MSGGAGANQASFERPLHGAEVQIETRTDYVNYQTYTDGGRKTIQHLSKYGDKSTPKVVCHRRGIRVGCTFVTNDALEVLYKLQKDFLKTEDSKIHQ